MVRGGSTVLILLALSAWAGGQGPSRPALSAADQLRLHRANKTLLTDLVNNGIRLGTTEGTVDRVIACQATARALGVSLSRAADDNDSDRVIELGSHLELVVRDGLVPLFDEAKIHITKESPEYARLVKAQEGAASNLDDVRGAIGKLGDNPPVRDISSKLNGLKEKLK
jgi:hypothetical protein